MAELPLNGRNFEDLLTLSPGVATVPMTGGGGGQSATAYGSQTNYSVSGSRPEGLQYLLDGTDIRDALDHGAGVGMTGTSLGMDAIQEFSVMTNTYGAQFGGTGAAINAVSKSGTNNLHGSAYEYIRNSKMDAENYFDVAGVKPPFKRNQFGGTLGGPIKKDKAFFFMNYEGLRGSGPDCPRRGAGHRQQPDRLYLFQGQLHGAKRYRMGRRWRVRSERSGRADARGDSEHIHLVSGFPKRDAMPQCNRHRS